MGTVGWGPQKNGRDLAEEWAGLGAWLQLWPLQWARWEARAERWGCKAVWVTTSLPLVGWFSGWPRGYLAVGLAPLVPSSVGRCGHVELRGLEFEGAVMAAACVDGGNRSGWRMSADLRPQATSYPRAAPARCLVW